MLLLQINLINLNALQLLALTVWSRAGPLLLWENASLKVTSMVSINLALLFPSRLLGFVTARAWSLFFFRPFSSFDHSMIPATAPWIVLSISTLAKLPGIHLLSYFATPAVSLNYCLSVLPVFYSSQAPRSVFHLTPVILLSQSSSEGIPYIGILFTSFSTDSNHESSGDSHKMTCEFQITPVDENTFLMTAPDCMVPKRSVKTKL